MAETKETPRMLSIRQVADTGIMSEHALRVLVAEKRVPFIKVGRKVLINYTALCTQLDNARNEVVL